MKPNFVELAKYCQAEYKVSLDVKRDIYRKTLFVAIKEDNSVLMSTTPHILVNAHKCILIHERSSLAFTNSYLWYKVQYINENGEVFDNRIDSEFELCITAHGSYANQILELSADNVVYYSCYSPWEICIGDVWSLYIRLKSAQTKTERETISSLFIKDKKILDLEKENRELDYKAQLLESERNLYKNILDEIKMLCKNNDNVKPSNL